jgi:AraC-like DNA-binding protein
MEEQFSSRGYLHENFLLFHLKDNQGERFEYHYHDFCKIIVFVAGKVSYLVEGTAYQLKPWDILLITGRDIHMPVIDPDTIYERYVIWFKPEFLLTHSDMERELFQCFESASTQRQNLIRPQPEEVNYLKQLLSGWQAEREKTLFGSVITQNALFILLIVYLNRLFLHQEATGYSDDIQYDGTISKIIGYIQENLAGELTIEELAARFYISKYSLMHKFKKQTGYSVHNFILRKRLAAANDLIKKGVPFMVASSDCGFEDYSCFVRAFTRYFGLSPRKYYQPLPKSERESILRNK